MENVTAETALEFVDSVGIPQLEGPQLEAAETFHPDQTKDQSAIVGSDIVSFVKGVTEERRQDIINSSLLAQAFADMQVSDPTHIFEWYGHYFDALTKIGWIVQDKQFTEHVESSQDFEAHKVIIDLATTLLGPQAAALQVVKATLDALQKMDEDSPWLTIFRKRAERAKTAKFQVTLAEEDPQGDFIVSLMAFGLSATSEVKQVLFVKFKTNAALLKHASGKVTINTEVLDAIRDDVAEKLAGIASTWVRGLPDLSGVSA